MRAGLLVLAALALPAAASGPMPGDVEDFVARRETCDHLRGEVPDPGQVEEMRQTLRQIDRYCTGTDAALAALKQRYRHDPRVMQQLGGYETAIERKR
jgi:hypothetical protein